MLFNRKEKPVDVLMAGNAGPVTAYDKAKREFFEIIGTSQANSARWFIIAVVMGFGLVVMAADFYRLLPLKTIVPWMVQPQADGAVANGGAVATVQFTPNRNMRSYFLRHWAEKALTIDQYTSQKDLKAAQALCRGAAVGEFAQMMRDDNPFGKLALNAQYTRVVHVKSVDPGENGVGFIFLTTVAGGGTGDPDTKQYRITVHYAISPPKSEEEIASNPVGLYITHFARVEDF